MIQRNCFDLNCSWSSVLLIPHPPTQSSLTYQNWPFLLSVGDLIRWKLSCVFLIRDGVGSDSSFQTCFSFSLPELQCPQWWRKKRLSFSRSPVSTVGSVQPKLQTHLLVPSCACPPHVWIQSTNPKANCILLFYASTSEEPNEVRQVM